MVQRFAKAIIVLQIDYLGGTTRACPEELWRRVPPNLDSTSEQICSSHVACGPGQDVGMKPETMRRLLWGGAVAAAGLFTWALISGPWYFEGDHVHDSTLAPSAGLIITSFRTMLVALAAGVIAGLGLYYTHRNHKLSQDQFQQNREQFREQHQQAQEQFRLAQRQFEHAQKQFEYEQAKDRETAESTNRSLITDGYVTAIRLLGSEREAERLGAIFSLQRIARDSPVDRDNIRQVLMAFTYNRMREESTREAHAAGHYVAEDINAAQRVANGLAAEASPIGDAE